MGMEVLGISCITNVHKPGEKPTHEEVIENADKSAEKFRKLIMRILKNIT